MSLDHLLKTTASQPTLVAAGTNLLTGIGSQLRAILESDEDDITPDLEAFINDLEARIPDLAAAIAQGTPAANFAEATRLQPVGFDPNQQRVAPEDDDADGAGAVLQEGVAPVSPGPADDAPSTVFIQDSVTGGPETDPPQEAPASPDQA